MEISEILEARATFANFYPFDGLVFIVLATLNAKFLTSLKK